MAGFDTTTRWVNLRSTDAYVTDGTNQYVFSSAGANDAKQYPQAVTVNGASVNMGRVAATGTLEARNRSTGVDTRCAGVYFRAHSSLEQPILRITLPATGAYTIYLAIGDATQAGASSRVEILDGSTSKAVLSGSLTSGQFRDAAGTTHANAAAWASSQAGVQVAFATTELNIKLCTGSADGGMSALAAVGIKQEPTGPTVTDVNTDEALSPGEAITITGTAFGASQGAGGVAITQESGAVSSAVTITGWADTSITGTVALGGLSYGATTSLVVTDNAAATGSIAVTFVPATGYSYVTLSGYPGTGYVIGEDASPAVVDGDQVEYQSTASSGAGVTVNADGTFVLSTTDPASFSYRVRDNTDNTWSSWGTIRVNMPNQGGAGINLGIRIGV